MGEATVLIITWKVRQAESQIFPRPLVHAERSIQMIDILLSSLETHPPSSLLLPLFSILTCPRLCHQLFIMLTHISCAHCVLWIPLWLRTTCSQVHVKPLGRGGSCSVPIHGRNWISKTQGRKVQRVRYLPMCGFTWAR